MIDIPMGEVKFRAKNDSGKMILLPGRIEPYGKDQFMIHHRFNSYLKDEVKSMEGAKWHGYDPSPIKAWSVKDSDRNRFQLAFHLGMNPYGDYDGPLLPFESRRRKADGSSFLYAHQSEMATHILTRRQCIIAGEMGTGKTLAAIEAMEASGIKSWLWVGPRSALDSVKYEFQKWKVCADCGKLGKDHGKEKGFSHKCRDPLTLDVEFVTYEGLKKLLENWAPGVSAPMGVIMDECSRVKTPGAGRSQAAKFVADSMRREHGRKAIVVLMSGSPAPKDPGDWWNLCEIACPGFVREGTPEKFRRRLALIQQYESGGASFPKLVTWWDDENKCKVCGKFKDEPEHEHINMTESWYHPYQKSINEVALLYTRVGGLVIVKFKKDCLDLPEKIYRTIACKPSPSVLRAADLIAKTARSTIKGLTLLRELSDGFQYVKTPTGTQKCPTCKGTLVTKRTVDLDDPDNPLDAESLTRGHRAIFADEGDLVGTNVIIGFKDEPLRIGEMEVECDQCDGTGEITLYSTEATRVDCPKDTALVNTLDEYEDEGRVVIWAGFTDSVDRCTQTCIKEKWPVVRLDGRGWWSNAFSGLSGPEILEAFDNKVKYPKLAFVGQPGAGGMGLNLTASSVEIYYSNTFKYEDRAQSEDRIHRPGADHNRGCTIIDLVHLPQDLWVIDNLKRKRDLQSMTMGMLREASEHYSDVLERVL